MAKQGLLIRLTSCLLRTDILHDLKRDRVERTGIWVRRCGGLEGSDRVGIELHTVTDVFGEGIPEGWGGDTEGPVPKGSVCGFARAERRFASADRRGLFGVWRTMRSDK